MRALRGYLPKVARSSASVLITGETGTGKERVAEAVHALSPRKKEPFVPVNCAALPDTLIESELFGHAKGAFTGAIASRSGRAADAHQGTLFLDEIGEMQAGAQAKLLRFLETGEVDRIGASRPQRVDVRIVAATNQDLEDLVADGRFRMDLYYRLNVARIELPSLRERPDDIELFLDSFIAALNARDGCCVSGADPELLQCLESYDWPGNVRELRNLVEAVFIDPPEGPLRVEHLPPAFRHLAEGYRRVNSNERDRLVDALRATNWNKTEAARALKLSRMTLYRKMAKYKLTSSDADR